MIVLTDPTGDGKHVYRIEYGVTTGRAPDDSVDIIQKILSTFQFDWIERDISWQDFKNKYGFQFTIPNDWLLVAMKELTPVVNFKVRKMSLMRRNGIMKARQGLLHG